MWKNFFSEAYQLLRNSKSSEDKDLADGIDYRMNDELWIVFAGKTHVGKTTLINLLFNPKIKLKLGHGKPGTLSPYSDKAELELKNGKGKITYTDLPGIGSDINSKEYNENMSIKYFKKCDIILWIFKCDDTAKEIEQLFYKKLDKKIKDKIVFGLSQIDKATGNWYNNGKEPSKKQKSYIMNRINDISNHFGIPKEEIIPFSSRKKYNIERIARKLIYSIQSKGDIMLHKVNSKFIPTDEERIENIKTF